MKQVVFLVHGMGESADGPLGKADRGAWAKEVEGLILKAGAAYRAFPQNDLVLVPVLYDDVFKAHCDNWQALAEQLAGTALEPLVSWMKSASESNFFWGSVADIIQYRAFEAERTHVLTHVAEQFASTIEKHGTGDKAAYHIVAHSLGTAVAHDAVQKLATEAVKGNTALQPPAFVFDTFMAIANVSRLVWATDSHFYDETRVRPVGCGLPDRQCAVKCYVSVRHVADPIPSVVRFVRKSWPQDNYFDLEVRHVRDVNVHAFAHYLASPWVSDTLLYRLFGGTVVPRGQMLRRVQAFQDYLGPRAAAQETIVKTIESALNALSAQAEGKFAFDLDDIAKAIWAYKDSIRNVL